uniref:Uncharacterized protein n=1 Tax=Glossina morsitans morsitans TaxID=37546 RepID=A0A1B0G1M9_GLOMM
MVKCKSQTTVGRLDDNDNDDDDNNDDDDDGIKKRPCTRHNLFLKIWQRARSTEHGAQNTERIAHFT